MLEKIEAGAFYLLLDRDSEQLHSRNAEDTLRSALQKKFGQKFDQGVRLKITPGRLTGETPAQRHERLRQNRQKSMQAMIENDPFVIDLKEKLGASIVPGSIKQKKP